MRERARAHVRACVLACANPSKRGVEVLLTEHAGRSSVGGRGEAHLRRNSSHALQMCWLVPHCRANWRLGMRLVQQAHSRSMDIFAETIAWPGCCDMLCWIISPGAGMRWWLMGCITEGAWGCGPPAQLIPLGPGAVAALGGAPCEGALPLPGP